MRRERIKTGAVIAVILIIVIAESFFLLSDHKAKVQDRKEALSEVCLSDSLTVGNDTVGLRQSDVKVKWRKYSVSRYWNWKVKITDMQQASVTLPDSAVDAEINVYKGEEKVFSGNAGQFSHFFPDNGIYRIEAVCAVVIETVTGKGERLRAEGTEIFIAGLEYDVPMKISFSADHIREGSVVTVEGSGVRGDVIISAGEVIAPFRLVTDDRGYARGLFSVSYITPPGIYAGIIETEEGTTEFTFAVEEEQYAEQHLIIEEETQTSTVGNSDNRDAYNTMMRRSYESWYPERFYDDCFTQPVEGTVTTEFGLFRYTNDNPVPSRHAGVDIANEEGTPVLAAASGYVIVAEYNGVSGNTVVMDHGFGVRTYYFHMSELCVREGTFIEEGTVIGKVGDTGYATGPHLHFNLMVHDNSVDPWTAFNGTSGIFGLD